ncbi:hypothetical protein [Bradyrhizobium sp.]|uniref:hypothetical protein n=1 Tax=Bradyrhizobium sp. TaxID=376 RepID=UPI00239AC680|nr:hypothetical protein [Bradyrhizobium sp.]MDE2379306.1 hypothetical protein [Bradyrhizobium sp.]
MKTPVILVALTLTAAILVAASLLILVGTRKTTGSSTLQFPSTAMHRRMNG